MGCETASGAPSSGIIVLLVKQVHLQKVFGAELCISLREGFVAVTGCGRALFLTGCGGDGYEEEEQ